MRDMFLQVLTAWGIGFIARKLLLWFDLVQPGHAGFIGLGIAVAVYIAIRWQARPAQR
jgi:hypothetical protein